MNPQETADRLAALMDALRVCFCDRLTALRAPACSCTLIRGVQALPDSCGCNQGDCGKAWVRLDRIYPSKQFPVQDQTADNCSSVQAAVIELGILRCVPTLGQGGAMPTAEADAQAALEAVRDAGAMLHVFRCCTALDGVNTMLGVYQPRDAGDCGGGTWTITVQLSPAKTRTPVGG